MDSEYGKPGSKTRIVFETRGSFRVQLRIADGVFLQESGLCLYCFTIGEESL